MKKKNYLILAGVFFVILISLIGTRIYNRIIFDINCGDRLKRAADANTIFLAKQELEAAIGYIEKKQLTRGYTSILYNTPDEDLGFWYTNIKASYQELQNLNPNSSSLERSNMLIKLRETLLDQGDKGIKLTAPVGISIYPNNALFSFLMWLTAIITIVLAFLGIPKSKKLKKRSVETKTE